MNREQAEHILDAYIELECVGGDGKARQSLREVILDAMTGYRVATTPSITWPNTWEEDGKVVRGFPEKSAYLCSLINRCVELSGFCKWGMVREDG